MIYEPQAISATTGKCCKSLLRTAVEPRCSTWATAYDIKTVDRLWARHYGRPALCRLCHGLVFCPFLVRFGRTLHCRIARQRFAPGAAGKKTPQPQVNDAETESTIDSPSVPSPESTDASAAMRDLAQVSKTLWPLLMNVAEVEGADLDVNTRTAAGFAPSLARAARGLVSWQNALAKGAVWEEQDGANWPADPSIRYHWTEVLKEHALPQLVRRYPQLMDPLLATLIETVESFHQQNLQDQQASSSVPETEQGNESQLPSGDETEQGSAAGQQGSQKGDQEEEASGDGSSAESQEDAQNMDSGGQGQGQQQENQTAKDAGEDLQNQQMNDPDSQAQQGPQDPAVRERREARAAELMEALGQQWGAAADAIKSADDAFGSGAGSKVADGLSTGGDALWQETSAWKEVAELRALLSKSPEIRELIRNLGRRSATQGPLRRLPEEIFHEGRPAGVTRSSAAPAEANGVTLSGNWDVMLPAEMQLLAAKKPMLRALHHARRIERSLLSYDRSAWVEEPARLTGRSEMRPFGQAGPLIVCLDTSGSMSGKRETLGKALVLECLRQAHRQKRLCYLYAFSGKGDLQELELDLSSKGLSGLLEFLRFSFCGATDMEDALIASTKRLQEDSWQNADLLIVTDGEVQLPEAAAAPLELARSQYGTKAVGIVLAQQAGKAMQQLCDELYVTGEVRDNGQGVQQKGTARGGWPRLRKVTATR